MGLLVGSGENMAAEQYWVGEADLDDPDGGPIPEGVIWSPGEESVEESYFTQGRRATPVLPELTPSQFTEAAFMMPTETEEGRMEMRRFSFGPRPHLRRCYDTPANRVLLKCGRQVEKSTFLGNYALTYCCMVPGYRALYVSPSGRQTDTFSKDRIKEPIDTSPMLRRFTTKMLSQNILEKQFVNRSKITLRYAFLNADRTRGIPAWLLELDEIQDLLPDNIPVMEQCTSHAPERWKRYLYSGTPKSLDNTIEYYWDRYSTQCEWVVPCDGCRHWNVLGESNIGRKGLICSKCGKLLNPQHERAQWAAMNKLDPPKITFEGYRISQLMVPWRSWSEILNDYERYPRAQFYNEVLGLSYDSGLRPLAKHEVKICCNDAVSMEDIERYRSLGFGQPIFAGIDWGTGENSYTVLSLATYVDNRFRMFYTHRFTGREVEPSIQMDLITQLLDYFNVSLIGVDYGGGFHPNSLLLRRYGARRVWQYQYLSQCKAKVEWDNKLRRFKVRRTEVMSDIFNAIKKGKQCEFPRWEEFETPYAADFLNIYSQYNERLRFLQYLHSPDKPDDTFHSFLYAWLVSMLQIPRSDIIAPNQEDKHGNKMAAYIMPVGLEF